MKKEEKILYVVFALIFIAGCYAMYYATTSLIELHTSIMERLHTPVNNYILTDNMNHDLTCHKVGLYTDWGEDFFGLSKYITGIDVGKHARQMFFEYDCSLSCHEYWQSEKVCIAELYPHEG